jgi:hypothetical protein
MEESLPTNRSRRKPAVSNAWSNPSEPTTTNSPSPIRGATGPKTSAGKRRSRYNAVKSGVFAKIPLLPTDLPEEYKRLLNGFRDLLQPPNIVEASFVEQLVLNRWQYRRLVLAQTAAATQAVEFGLTDSILARAGELWDEFRAGESAGGLLRPTLNPFLLREAISMLEGFRNAFNIKGFEVDTRVLRKLYGVDRDGIVPIGPSINPFYLFCYLTIEVTKASSTAEKDKASDTPVVLTKLMLGTLDYEIERLKDIERLALSDEQRKDYLQRIVASVPSHDLNERWMRYATHLAREYDRLWAQLERCRALRLGQPGPPAVRVELS